MEVALAALVLLLLVAMAMLAAPALVLLLVLLVLGLLTAPALVLLVAMAFPFSVNAYRLPLICFRNPKAKTETVFRTRKPVAEIYFRNGIQKPFSEHGNGNGNPAQFFYVRQLPK